MRGTGLGLYVCHTIVTELGGAIWVESQVGRGSTFHVDLPVYERQTSAGPVSAPPLVRPPPGARRILVVDDEPSIAAFIRHALVPHDVATVHSGREALVALDNRTFDAVVCDLVMPDISGIEVLEHVKERSPELAQRFVIITGAAVSEVAPQLAMLDVPVLHKPFSMQELVETVQGVLEGRVG